MISGLGPMGAARWMAVGRGMGDGCRYSDCLGCAGGHPSSRPSDSSRSRRGTTHPAYWTGIGSLHARTVQQRLVGRSFFMMSVGIAGTVPGLAVESTSRQRPVSDQMRQPASIEGPWVALFGYDCHSSASIHCAWKGSVMTREIVRSAKAPSSPFFSQGVKAGPFIFVSGIVGTDPIHGQLAGDRIQDQTRQALANCEAILEAAGEGWETWSRSECSSVILRTSRD